jgi:hypothetical protein
MVAVIWAMVEQLALRDSDGKKKIGAQYIPDVSL